MPNINVNQIDQLLPQTQCTKCGYDDCLAYAKAIQKGQPHNQCPPGGQESIQKLSTLLEREILPLNPDNGYEKPKQVAVIDESLCIGCKKCILACPVDAIVGASKQMHTVISQDCTGCDLCVEPCPMDCIHMEILPNNLQPENLSETQFENQKKRYKAIHNKKLLRIEKEKRTRWERHQKNKKLADFKVNNKQEYIANALAKFKQKKKKIYTNNE